jgi:hypothetical protein
MEKQLPNSVCDIEKDSRKVVLNILCRTNGKIKTASAANINNIIAYDDCFLVLVRCILNLQHT